MVRLENIDIEIFKEEIYLEYKKLFPECERKSYQILEKTFNDGILKIIKIVDGNVLVGFILANTIDECEYFQVDYLAILEKFQDKGYGTKAIELLKEYAKNYKGLFIEVEKLGLGIDEAENIQRKRRIEFYEKIEFEKLGFELDLFKTIFSAYMLWLVDVKDDDEKVIENIFNLYRAILGEERVKKHCKVIKDE